ncbi:MAG: hypothetical protein P8100_10830 [bacterium]
MADKTPNPTHEKMMAAVTFVTISLLAFNQNPEPQLPQDQKSQS